MTHAPATEAYLDRMARRDDPAHPEVCEHNWDASTHGLCPDCRTAFKAVPRG